MSRIKSLYKVVSVKKDFSASLSVHRLQLHFADRYDMLRHRGSRWLARAYTAALRRYLAARPHIDYYHEKNWARKISYIPSGFRSWAEYMPGGFATYYVYEPHHRRMANGRRLDAVTKRLFRHGIEGVGIRTRAYTLSYLINSWVVGHTNGTIRWVSLGCGSGQPMFDAAGLLPVSLKKTTSLLLIDRDTVVLDFAQSLYAHQRDNLPEAAFDYGDIFEPDFFTNLVKNGRLDIIDILGMFEYLDNEQSVSLLQKCYASLNEGGVLIFSNMDTNRPDYDINQRVIGWPALLLRSPDELVDLIRNAGIPLENVTFIRAQDEINNMFEVTKT